VVHGCFVGRHRRKMFDGGAVLTRPVHHRNHKVARQVHIPLK
jgi:hypothetical protein